MKGERLAILILTLIILLAPFDYGLPDLQILTINLVLSIFLIFIWLVFAIRRGEINFYINPITVSVLLFFLISLFSITYSIHPHSSLTEVMRVFTYLAIFFTSANFFSRESFQKIFYVIAMCMALLAVYGIGKYFVAGEAEAKSVFVYHGTFATYLLLTFPLTFSLRRRNSLFLWLGTLGLFAFIVTLSRSAWVSLIIAGVVLAVLLLGRRLTQARKRAGVACARPAPSQRPDQRLESKSPCVRRHILIIVAVILLFIMCDSFFMKSVIIKRIGTLSSPWNVSSAQARVKYWDSAIKITKQYLPTGTGIQTFYVIYPFFKHPSFTVSTHHFVHNDYLQILSELGPVGLIIFLSVIFCYMFTLHSAIGKGREDSRIEPNASSAVPAGSHAKRARIKGGENLLLPIYLSSLAFFFSCIFEFNIYIPSLMILVYLYLAFVSKGKGKLITIRLNRYILIYSILIVIIILATFPYLGQIFARKGHAAFTEGNVSVALKNYKAASFLSPLSSLPREKLAKIYLSQEKFEEAFEECINAIRLNSFAKRNYKLLGDIVNRNETK